MNGGVLGAASGPALLLALLVAAAAITYLVRDWQRLSALAAAAFVGSIAVVLWRQDVAQRAAGAESASVLLDLSGGLQRFGFSLRFHEDSSPALLLAFLVAAAALLLAARYPQGRSFVPMTMLLLGGYSVWFLMRAAPIEVSLVLPLGLVVLSALSAVALQAGRPTRAGGPLRWMVAPVLAFPFFLIARWYIEQATLTGGGPPLQTAAALLTLGLLLLMAPVPLHSVQPATAESAPPLATVLFSLLYQMALVYLISRVIIEFPFMQTQVPLNVWFAWAGLLTAIWAGAAAIGTNHPGRLWGYLSLHEWGLIILLLSVPGLRTWSLVAFLLVLRVVSMMGTAAGLAAIEHYTGTLDPDELTGAGVRLPWNSAAYLLGGLGLVGFPLSAGFAGHWAALQLIAASDWRPAAAVLVASGAAILALIRMARTLYGPLADAAMPREQPLGVLTAIAAIAITVTLALAPQLLNGPVSRALLTFGA